MLMKKLLVIMLVLLAAFSVFAKGSAEAATAAAPEKESHIPTGTPPAGTIELVMWDDMNLDVDAVFKKAAEDFNASQTQYHVTVLFTDGVQGKMLSSTPEDRPNIIQTTGNQSSKYINPHIDSRIPDLNLYVPLQEFIDYEKYDTSGFIANTSAICVRNGEWQMFPIGNVAVGLFVNTDMLAAVGYKPEDLKSYKDVYEASLKMKQQGVCATPMYTYIHIDPFNFAIRSEGIELFNYNNGRDGIPDQYFFGEGDAKAAVVDWFAFWQNMRDAGLLVQTDVPRGDAIQMFGNGEIAFYPMYLDYFSQFAKASENINWQFVCSPTVHEGKQNLGQSPGGIFAMVCDVDDPWKEYGSWLFVKWLEQPEYSANTALGVGYTPTVVAAREYPTYQEYLKKYPYMSEVIDIQNNTEYGLTMPLLAYHGDFSTEYKNILTNLVKEGSTLTAEEAWKQLCKAAEDTRDMYFMQAGVVL